jgi:hypothetical protein
MEDLNDDLRADITIHLVSEITEVLLLALSPAPSTADRPREHSVQGTLQ